MDSETVEPQSVKRRKKKNEMKVPFQQNYPKERENSGDEDMLSCVVKFIVLTSPNIQRCSSLLASS